MLRKTLMVLMALAILLTGCSASDNSLSPDENVLFQDCYRDEFWEEENSIRIILKVETIGYEDTTPTTEKSERSLNEEFVKSSSECKRAVIAFLKEKYKIDVTSKIEKQKLQIFKSAEEGAFTGGYVDPKEPNTVHLNEILLSDSKALFESSYIHETFHQLGIVSKKMHMLDEGFADALTEECMNYSGKTYVGTEYYSYNKSLAKQMLIVDPSIVNSYIEGTDFDIRDRINYKLKDVKQPFIRIDNLGEAIQSYSEAWNQNLDGEKTYWMYFQAQEIISAYCKTFKPKKEKIDKIRNNYIVSDVEKMNIWEEGNEYCFGYYIDN